MGLSRNVEHIHSRWQDPIPEDGMLQRQYYPRGCRQKSLLQIITARSWQMAKYDAVLLA